MVLAAALAGGPASAQEAAKETTPKLVKFDQLIAALKDAKGKVVVVDFWADT